MSNQRAPMSEEKKKAAAEKRKATIEANQKKAADEHRNARIAGYYNRVAALHDTQMRTLEKRQQKLTKERLDQEKWFEDQTKYHEKFCAAMVNADLPEKMYNAVVAPHNGRVSVVVTRVAGSDEKRTEIKDEYMEKLGAIDGFSNVVVDVVASFGAAVDFCVSFDVAL